MLSSPCFAFSELISLPACHPTVRIDTGSSRSRNNANIRRSVCSQVQKAQMPVRRAPFDGQNALFMLEVAPQRKHVEAQPGERPRVLLIKPPRHAT